jgi:hypothetical protein
VRIRCGQGSKWEKGQTTLRPDRVLGQIGITQTCKKREVGKRATNAKKRILIRNVTLISVLFGMVANLWIFEVCKGHENEICS